MAVYQSTVLSEICFESLEVQLLSIHVIYAGLSYGFFIIISHLCNAQANVFTKIFTGTSAFLVHKLVVGVLSTSFTKYEAVPWLSNMIPMSMRQNTLMEVRPPTSLASLDARAENVSRTKP
jgi:hypothetical protein